MGKNSGGWLTFIAALGMMCSLMAADVAHLKTWNESLAPGFVAVIMIHFGAVVVAFIGGINIQPSRDDKKTRSSDENRTDLGDKK